MKKKTVSQKIDDPVAKLVGSDKSCFARSRFLSFIRVIPVLVRSSRPTSPPPTLTPQNLFNFEIDFDSFPFFHGESS